jgi:hypothetical protein
MLDPVVRNKISMTKSTDDLVVHVPKVSLFPLPLALLAQVERLV